MSKHGYIYGSGMHGCLYDNGPHWNALVETFEDCLPGVSDRRLFRIALERRGMCAFVPEQDAGADYAEITEAPESEAAQFQESDE